MWGLPTPPLPKVPLGPEIRNADKVWLAAPRLHALGPPVPRSSVPSVPSIPASALPPRPPCHPTLLPAPPPLASHSSISRWEHLSSCLSVVFSWPAHLVCVAGRELCRLASAGRGALRRKPNPNLPKNQTWLGFVRAQPRVPPAVTLRGRGEQQHHPPQPHH